MEKRSVRSAEDEEVTRGHLINAGVAESEVPQGLKPGPKPAIYGTAEEFAEKVGKADPSRAEARS